MDTFTVTATELKNNMAEILNRVAYEKTPAIVEKMGKPIIKLIPIQETQNTIHRAKILAKYFGALPDYPEAIAVQKKFRKRFHMRKRILEKL